MELNKAIESLVKALEAGNYNAAPSQLVGGSALQIEDLSPVMHNVTFEQKHIKLQKLFPVKKTKGLLAQFNRQLSYGRFGGSAQVEGAVGDVDVGDYVRVTVPMAFYSHIRRVTVAANIIETFDGIKAEDREGNNAAMKIAADIEFDCFKGRADFSNSGVFDGNPLAQAQIPNMMGIDVQIRQSDLLANTQDLMFAAFGSAQSVVLSASGAMDQSFLEDASLRVKLNFGDAEDLYLDPVAIANFNKRVALGSGANSIQRIVLAGSAQDSVGASLRQQYVSDGVVKFESSNFLRAKYYYPRPAIGAPVAPTLVTAANAPAGTTLQAGSYIYMVTCENERGEGFGFQVNVGPVATGDQVALTITAPSSRVTHFSVYRGTSLSKLGFIGHVKNSGAATTLFVDLNNKIPFATAGYLIDAAKTWGLHELAPYSRMKLAISDLSIPEAHYRFVCVAGYEPRKAVICDNVF